MRSVDPGEDFNSWRDAARRMIGERVSPEEIIWEAERGLFASAVVREESPVDLKVPAAFVDLARSVACHCDPKRWGLLYRILWRTVRGGERHLLSIDSDPDMSRARVMEKNVRREIHKMHAFVRFKLIDTTAEGRERYAAWFEPDHFIVAAASPFFTKRFANMDWSIFTPKGCAHWDGADLTITAGLAANPVDDPDALEDAWRTYYRSIFNPARLKVKMMKQEMPKRYWKNLPEAGLIEELIEDSKQRVNSMYSEPLRPVKPEPRNNYLEKIRELSNGQPCHYPPSPDLSLPELEAMSKTCQACPLWKNATGTIFGEGRADARIMVVGEQPGDREDIAGRPFVGPAGGMFDQALLEAGIDRSEAYVTNAVKHFKWTPRGKHRLHAKPDTGEIDACRPWVLAELSKVAPDILILLGATAARSLFGKPLAVTSNRGLIDAPELAPRVILTVHPSYLLRIPDPAKKAEEYARFVADLRLAAGG